MRAAAERAADRLRQGVDRLTGFVRQGWEALQAGARGFLERIRSAGQRRHRPDQGHGPQRVRSADRVVPRHADRRGHPVPASTGVAGPGEAEVGEAATTGLADLTAQFGARDADGDAQMGGLESSGRRHARPDRRRRTTASSAAAEPVQVDLETRPTSSVTDLGGQATTEVTGAEGRPSPAPATSTARGRPASAVCAACSADWSRP